MKTNDIPAGARGVVVPFAPRKVELAAPVNDEKIEILLIRAVTRWANECRDLGE